MHESYTGPTDLPTAPVPDDMPDGAMPIYLSIGDRAKHCIGWVADPRMSTLGALLRKVADDCGDPSLRR